MITDGCIALRPSHDARVDPAFCPSVCSGPCMGKAWQRSFLCIVDQLRGQAAVCAACSSAAVQQTDSSLAAVVRAQRRTNHPIIPTLFSIARLDAFVPVPLPASRKISSIILSRYLAMFAFPLTSHFGGSLSNPVHDWSSGAELKLQLSHARVSSDYALSLWRVLCRRGPSHVEVIPRRSCSL